MFTPELIGLCEGIPVNRDRYDGPGEGNEWDVYYSLKIFARAWNGYIVQIFPAADRAYMAYMFDEGTSGEEIITPIPIIKASLMVFGERFSTWQEFINVVCEMSESKPAIAKGYLTNEGWKGIKRGIIRSTSWQENTAAFMRRIWNVSFDIK